MSLLHGTCIAIGIGNNIGPWAVLLRGPSGSGKSDLALRLLGRDDLGARLVADDQVEVTRRGDEVWAAAPAQIAGLMEVRGVGLVMVESVSEARLGLVLDLVSDTGSAVPRMPEKAFENIAGVDLPLHPCAPFEASAPDKIALLVRSLDEDILRS